MKTVYCHPGMVHFGELVSRWLKRPLYPACPVTDCDEVTIVGMYDPPYYGRTLADCGRAKRKHIHWCGTDVLMLSDVDRLPEAVHTCESHGLAEELLAKGVEASVATFPTMIHPTVTPLPEKQTVSVYLGSNPDTYGGGIVRGLRDVFPNVNWHLYLYGQYDEKQMLEVVNQTTVHLRLTAHDGSCNSAREMMECGRYVVATADLPYVRRVSLEDFPGICSALAVALKQTDPDYEAAAYYHAFNSTERFLADLKGAGIE